MENAILVALKPHIRVSSIGFSSTYFSALSHLSNQVITQREETVHTHCPITSTVFPTTQTTGPWAPKLMSFQREEWLDTNPRQPLSLQMTKQWSKRSSGIHLVFQISDIYDKFAIVFAVLWTEKLLQFSLIWNLVLEHKVVVEPLWFLFGSALLAVTQWQEVATERYGSAQERICVSWTPDPSLLASVSSTHRKQFWYPLKSGTVPPARGADVSRQQPLRYRIRP